MQAHTTAFARLHYALTGQLFHRQPGVGAGGGEDAVALEERAKLGHDFLRRCVGGDRSGHDGWFPSARERADEAGEQVGVLAGGEVAAGQVVDAHQRRVEA